MSISTEILFIDGLYELGHLSLILRVRDENFFVVVYNYIVSILNDEACCSSSAPS